jgi:hypothetical protein
VKFAAKHYHTDGVLFGNKVDRSVMSMVPLTGKNYTIDFPINFQSSGRACDVKREGKRSVFGG